MTNPDKKIVIVGGYPKSGTTWSTRLISQLLDCPAQGYWGFDGKSLATEGLDRESDFVCYQTHQYYHELKNAGIWKVIYVVRDPRDIVISGIHHFSFYSKWLAQAPNFGKLLTYARRFENKLHSSRYKFNRMVNMLEYGDEVIDHCNYQWQKHVQSYSGPSNVLYLRYEDMLNNGEEISKKILHFCGVEKSEARIKKDIALQSFDFKKQQFQQAKNQIKSKHLRKGIAGDWKKNLSKNDVEVIIKKFGQTMQELGYF